MPAAGFGGDGFGKRVEGRAIGLMEKEGRLMDWKKEIERLKEERGAVVLAHNYTREEVQDVADFVGDSLELSRKAAECGAKVIVFCGVRFMAETAKILSPDAVVLHPAPDAGCPMADMADAAGVRAWREKHPGATVVAYVNTTADTKTAVDICCTSGNALKLVAGLPEGEVLFVPDANLGSYVAAQTGREIALWPGFCPTHNRIHPEQVRAAKAAHPGAEVLVHPECLPAVVAEADMALSTGGMLKRARESEKKEFVMVTECGILHRLRKENPDKKFWTVEPEPVCPNMKKITLENVYSTLRDMAPRVELDPETMAKARAPIDKMLAVKA